MASNLITSDGLQPNAMANRTQLLVMASNLMRPTELLAMGSNLIDGLQPNY